MQYWETRLICGGLVFACYVVVPFAVAESAVVAGDAGAFYPEIAINFKFAHL
jgi:hypothetical protein